MINQPYYLLLPASCLLALGGLLIFDLGFFGFLWFDEFTKAKKFFVTRLKAKTAYTVTTC
ncbi:MAG TPA: hypothetical protein VK184_20315 [Nostocaceae cyanobacterium]|nr:hypothetical protein [Nostocaceae cyanobacterium]